MHAFEASEKQCWPPDSTKMKKLDMLPDELVNFISQMLTGQSKNSSEKNHRIVNSLSQDICRAVTNAEWKLPKHISLCVSLHHLFWSKELITLLNRFGHYKNYSFTLELETAIAKIY